MTEKSSSLGVAAPSETAWQDSLRERNYVQAEARLRALELVGGVDLDLLPAVQNLIDWHKYLYAKKYKLALTALRKTEAIAAFVNRPALLEATEALQAADEAREHEVDALRARLGSALELPETRAEALNALGVLHALREEFDDARATFNAAVEADARHYRALTNLGNLLLEGGNPQGAEVLYRKALEIEPGYPTAHNNLAAALRKQKKVHESVRAIRASQRLINKEMREESRRELSERIGNARVAGWLSNPYLRWGALGAVLWLVYRLMSG
ncbi:tetratricopeptide (TPR) repeat protein [Deinobacterium chartae]|uniref:Tetratricopeptide (TPR) repeat protein n=1 Tax=Deinobacterium chartae TaxID=521158 RepID=A0A841HYY7_9DEIO|nr:tetratricopeptide repeat protein [Deinobacterium chartae]MBB6097430.1 tetratricopeptide (TPR) repeat protein [Deinobacterium chartae]